MIFRDRYDAGFRLGQDLFKRDFDSEYLVLGLPRGGVPVAYEVARTIQAPLDVFVVRKLGVPGQEELAFGAIAQGGKSYLNQSLIQDLGISNDHIKSIIERESLELARRRELYLKDRRPIPLKGHKIVLVDDGLATGATIKAACQVLGQYDLERLVVAVPVGAPDSCEALKTYADEVICLYSPEMFFGVAQWYDHFDQTSDEEVLALLAKSTLSSEIAV
jgi:predicted phosphoribosyltransferase